MITAEFGWISKNTNIQLPNYKTIWNTNSNILRTNENLHLYWANPDNIIFNIKIKLDEKYMFTVEQYISQQKEDHEIQPFATISRNDSNKGKDEFLVHEGAIGVINDSLQEISFKKLESKKNLYLTSKKPGWIGFTNKYSNMLFLFGYPNIELCTGY